MGTKTAIGVLVEKMTNVMVHGNSHMFGLAEAIDKLNKITKGPKPPSTMGVYFDGFQAMRSDDHFVAMLNSLKASTWHNIVEYDIADGGKLLLGLLSLDGKRDKLAQVYLSYLAEQPELMLHKATSIILSMPTVDEYVVSRRLLAHQSLRNALFNAAPFVSNGSRCLLVEMTRQYVIKTSLKQKVDLEHGYKMDLELHKLGEHPRGEKYTLGRTIASLNQFLDVATKIEYWEIGEIPEPLFGSQVIFTLLSTREGVELLNLQPGLYPALSRFYVEHDAGLSKRMIAQALATDDAAIARAVLTTLATCPQPIGAPLLKEALEADLNVDILSRCEDIVDRLEDDCRLKVVKMINAAVFEVYNDNAAQLSAERRRTYTEALGRTQAIIDTAAFEARFACFNTTAVATTIEGEAPIEGEAQIKDEATVEVEFEPQELVAAVVMAPATPASLISVNYTNGTVEIVLSGGTRIVVDTLVQTCSFNSMQEVAA